MGKKIFSFAKLHELFQESLEEKKRKSVECRDCLTEATREVAQSIRERK